jgi:hypothetical protein
LVFFLLRFRPFRTNWFIVGKPNYLFSSGSGRVHLCAQIDITERSGINNIPRIADIRIAASIRSHKRRV